MMSENTEESEKPGWRQNEGVIISQTQEQAPKEVHIQANGQIYIVTRVYHVLQVSSDFKRVIVTLI